MLHAARSIAALAVAAAVFPAAARAATWSEPVRVSGPNSIGGDPTLTYTADGRPFATWGERTGPFAHSIGELIQTSFAYPGPNGWTRAALPRGLVPPTVNVDAGGELLAVGAEYVFDGYDGYFPWQVTARTAQLDPGGGAPVPRGDQTLWKRGSVVAFDGATTPRGAAGVAWLGRWVKSGGRGGAKAQVTTYASVRRPGGRFTHPLRLAEEPYAQVQTRYPSVASGISETRGSAFAWRDRNGIYARVVGPGGRVGARLKVGSVRGAGGPAGITIGPAGELTVLWTRGSDKQLVIVTAYSPDGKSFGPARILDTCLLELSCLYLESAEGASGELVTAWANIDGADPVIRAVSLRAGSGDVREVDRDATPTNQRVRVAADRVGNAAVSWAAPYDAPVEGSYLTVRAPDGNFGEPEFVPTGSQTYPGPAVAFDPQSGRPAAVFATEPGGYGEDGPVWFTERR